MCCLYHRIHVVTPTSTSPADVEEATYVSNWVIPEVPPLPSYADKLAGYQADQALRMTSSSRAEYERRKAALRPVVPPVLDDE